MGFFSKHLPVPCLVIVKSIWKYGCKLFCSFVVAKAPITLYSHRIKNDIDLIGNR